MEEEVLVLETVAPPVLGSASLCIPMGILT